MVCQFNPDALCCRCCDGIYLPSFLITNAYGECRVCARLLRFHQQHDCVDSHMVACMCAAGFSQDREILENIYTSGNGSVIREVRVHGSFYQVP